MTTATDLSALLEVADALADVADPITLRSFGSVVPARTKPDGSPVTAVDVEVERAVRDLLADLRPSDAVLGEEEGGHLDPSRISWVIDPIDATKNFLRGIPVFATLVGVVVDGQPVVGVVSAPALGQRWRAARGLGATRDGTAVRVSEIAEVADAHVLHGGLDHHVALPDGWERLGRLATAAWRTRGFGDFWGHLLVAAGSAEVCVEPQLSAWDVVAPACVVTEAGGRVTTWEGGSIVSGGSVISSNGLVHDEVAAILTGRDAQIRKDGTP